MERLEQIIIDFNRGRMSIEDMQWLIETVGSLQRENKILNMKNKNILRRAVREKIGVNG